MSSPELVIQVLRAELRAAAITYKALAERIGMSESSVKRMFGQKDMTLSRLADLQRQRHRPGRRAAPRRRRPAACRHLDFRAGKGADCQAQAAAGGDLLPGALEPGTDH